MTARVLVEDLLGRVVVDAEGKKLGRIEEIVADRHPDHLAIVEYHVGELALLERLSGAGILGSFLTLLVPAAHRGVKVPWEQMT
jgi:sporulation protein YlmC with PRC-barrel domain